MITTRRKMMAGALATGAATILGSKVQAAAPKQEMAPASVYRYKVGSLEITAIHDGLWVVEKPESIFGTNQKPEDVASLLQSNFLPTGKMAIGFTPIVVNTGKELMLFDTGRGAAGMRQAAHRQSLANTGLKDQPVRRGCYNAFVIGSYSLMS